ncbi:hypothetical protein TNCV_1069991 [Trichonephila clavipes]|nr:hypothetical protein TNCV_1069991 [Trichonephila clavipes]
MGREDVPQSTKRSNEAERRRGEGKNAGRKTGRPKAVNQDANSVQFWFRRFRSSIYDVKVAPRPDRLIIGNVDKITEIIEVDRMLVVVASSRS